MFAQIPVPPVTAIDWVGIGKMIGEVVVGLLVAWTTYKSQKTANAIATIAPAVAANTQLTQATSDKVEAQTKTINEIHVLSNGAMTAQKRLTRDLSAAKAMLDKTPANIAAAEEAARDYDAHMANQAIVEAGRKT